MITSENSSVARESSRVIILKSRLDSTGHSAGTSEVRDIFYRQTHVPNDWWQLMCSHVLQLWDRRSSMKAPVRNITTQGGIKYHFLSLWYNSTWNWTHVSRAIGEHSNHYANVQLVEINKLSIILKKLYSSLYNFFLYIYFSIQCIDLRNIHKFLDLNLLTSFVLPIYVWVYCTFLITIFFIKLFVVLFVSF